MTSKEIRRTAQQFAKDFNIYEVTYDKLKRAVEKQGYTVVEYNQISNNDLVATLVKSLKLEAQVSHARGFTYADNNHRIVFIQEDLSEDEKVLVMAHEQGHIYCRHMSKAPIIGQDVRDEFEANEFAHYLLTPSLCVKIKLCIQKHKKLSIAIMILGGMLIACSIIFLAVHTEQQYYGDYYVTETGNKYHCKDCSFIANKTNTRRMTVEEYESGEYEPCEICLSGD